VAAMVRARGRANWKRCAVLALVMGGTLLSSVPGSAGSAPSVAAMDTKKELAKLKRRAEKLSKEYRGELLALEDAKKAAERATRDAERFSREYGSSRTAIRQLAAISYMEGGLGTTVPIFAGPDPGGFIHDAAVLEHLSVNNGRRVQNLETLAQQAEASAKTAQAKVTEVRRQLDDLESQRARVRKLLAKYQPQTPTTTGSGRPDGVSGSKSQIIGNSMTSRMRSVLLAVDGRFGPFPVIGCMRAGDSGDHGTGTACDFMESTGGAMPSARARAHGDSVAAYATSNASSLGIKYVIWRQRIWDVRSGGGWRAMEDRGSITANHYDHVHISVL
jgi:hypothetical protein